MDWVKVDWTFPELLQQNCEKIWLSSVHFYPVHFLKIWLDLVKYFKSGVGKSGLEVDWVEVDWF